MAFVPQRRIEAELLDLPPSCYSTEELAGTLADIRLVNRYLGDVRAVVKHLTRVGSPRPEGLKILDIATGSADIPVAIARWMRDRGLPSSITAVDVNPLTVAVARERVAPYPEIEVLVADGLRLPFADKSFDIVLCSKTIHHFSDEQVVRLLEGIARVARQGYVVMDLRRSWVAFGLMYLLTRLFTSNRLTRCDGPLSVLRSFTAGELAGFAARAGLSGYRVSREPFWRIVLAGEVP